MVSFHNVKRIILSAAVLLFATFASAGIVMISGGTTTSSSGGGGEPSGDYPNLPEGLTLIGQNTGTVAESGGSAFGIAAFDAWVLDGGVTTSDVMEVINDATNPAGTGQVIRFEYDEARTTKSARGFASFTEVCTLYTMTRIYFESDVSGEMLNTKLFYVGMPSVEANEEFYNTRETTGRYRLIYQGSLGSVELHDSSEAAPKGMSVENAMPNDTWLNIEHLFECGTTSTAADGRARTWINGTLVSDVAPSAWGTTFGAIEWFADTNEVPNGTQMYYRVGEFYIAGSP